MNTRPVLVTAVVIALILAFGLLLMLAFMAARYGLGTDPSEILLPRFFGMT